MHAKQVIVQDEQTKKQKQLEILKIANVSKIRKHMTFVREAIEEKIS